ncbi:MAG: sigma-70 family RNA polymerase sigma factor [Bacteroidota bacterium]
MLDLIKGSKVERDEALRIIYQGNREKIYAFILSNSGSREKAKDVFQETIIAFYENVRDGKFKGESAISTYLFSIARFKWLNQIKKDMIRTGHHEKLEMDTFSDSPLSRLVEGEKKQQVLEVLELLGASCKKLLVQNLYFDASMKDIAAMGEYSSEQIVRNKKYKCLKRLKQLVSDRPSLIQVLKGNG